MFSTVSLDKRIPAEHPLRPVKRMAGEALRHLSPVFDETYSAAGRPSIPPERLLKSLLLMAFHSIRRKRLFCEHLDYNLLFRWFRDMSMDEPSFDITSSDMYALTEIKSTMRNITFATTLAVVFSLGLFACKEKPEEIKAGEMAKSGPAKTGPRTMSELAKTEPAGGGDGDTIGVALCDEWLEKYIRCIESEVPEAARQQMKDALMLTAGTYKRTASTVEGRNQLEHACSQMMESTKQATESFGCEW